MNAHQVQLITHHEKTNGVLIRVVVSNVPEVKDIAGWVGQENWFYLTLNEAVFAEGVLASLTILDWQDQQTQIYFSDVEILSELPPSLFELSVPQDTDVIRG